MSDSRMNNNEAKKQTTNAIGRLVIEKVINCNESVVKVANELRLKRTSVSSIPKTFRTTGRVEKKLVRGHPMKKIGVEIESKD